MYTLVFPFRVVSGQEISLQEEVITVGNLEFSLLGNAPDYKIIVKGFSSEKQAKTYINNLWAGLMWLLLNRGFSIEAELTFQKVTYAKDPYQAAANISKTFKLNIDGPLDGLIDNYKPAIYPTNKNIRMTGVGQSTVTVSTPSNIVLEIVTEGASFLKNPEFILNTKLRTALDLYSAYFRESTENAKFLTLVMSLEALAVGTKRPKRVLKLLEKWNGDIDKISKETSLKEDEKMSLEAIRRDLLFREEESIRQKVRNLVKITLQKNGDEDIEETARKTVKIYDIRSTLLHKGKIEKKTLSDATRDAKIIVERVLRAYYIQLVTASNNSNP